MKDEGRVHLPLNYDSSGNCSEKIIHVRRGHASSGPLHLCRQVIRTHYQYGPIIPVFLYNHIIHHYTLTSNLFARGDLHNGKGVVVTTLR